MSLSKNKVIFGYTPTGTKAIWSEIHIVRLKAGKIIEHWDVIDQLIRLE